MVCHRKEESPWKLSKLIQKLKYKQIRDTKQVLYFLKKFRLFLGSHCLNIFVIFILYSVLMHGKMPLICVGVDNTSHYCIDLVNETLNDVLAIWKTKQQSKCMSFVSTFFRVPGGSSRLAMVGHTTTTASPRKVAGRNMMSWSHRQRYLGGDPPGVYDIWAYQIFFIVYNIEIH